MMRRRGPLAVAVAAPEFAAMIESIILRCICSAIFALASESRAFAASSRRRTASAIRTESSRVISGLATGGGAIPLAAAARLTRLSVGAGKVTAAVGAGGVAGGIIVRVRWGG